MEKTETQNELETYMTPLLRFLSASHTMPQVLAAIPPSTHPNCHLGSFSEFQAFRRMGSNLYRFMTSWDILVLAGIIYIHFLPYTYTLLPPNLQMVTK